MGGELDKVGFDEAYIGQSRRLGEVLSMRDMSGMKIDAEKLGLRIGRSEQAEPYALTCPEFHIAEAPGRPAPRRGIASDPGAEIEPIGGHFMKEAIGVNARNIIAMRPIAHSYHPS